MADLTQEVKEALTGGSVAVVGVNTVLEENIVDKQVTLRKLGSDFTTYNKVLLGNDDSFAIVASGASLATSVRMDTYTKITFSGSGYVQYHLNQNNINPGDTISIVFKSNVDNEEIANILKIREADYTKFKTPEYLSNGIYAFINTAISADDANLFIDNRSLGLSGLELEVYITKDGVPLTNDSLKSIISKVKNTAQGVSYVTLNGNDTNDGLTVDSGFATLQKALDEGFTKIYMQRGVYKQTATKIADEIEILPLDVQNYSSEAPLQKIEFRGSDTLNNTLWTTHNSIFKQPYADNSLFKAVFIDKTKQPITTGTRPSYNATIWESNNGVDDIKLKPVLTLAECEAEQGTFFYDGSNVYVNPTDGQIGDKEFNAVKLDKGLDFKGTKKLKMQDVKCDFYQNEPCDFDRISNIDLNNCEANHSVLADGFSLDHTNGKLSGCKAYKNRNDGYNMHGYGHTEFTNCEGVNNYDDGISHHDGCTFTIIGGKYSGNGKGGISPAYGAQGAVYNTISEGNDYGLYNDHLSTGKPTSITSSGNLYMNNRRGILNNNSTVISVNDTFVGNEGNTTGNTPVTTY